MPNPSDRERLTHIIEAIDLLSDFIGTMDFVAYAHDRKTQLSVERLLEIIGEAANHLSPALKERYATVPWRSITDLRNVVSHEYFQVRLEVIWQVVTEEAPPLKTQVAQILHDLEHEQGDG